MKKYLQILKKCPLFSDIGEDSLIKMLSCLGARVLKFEKTFTVFAEGSSAKYIGIVLSGEVQVTNLDYYGNRSIISVMGPSQIFGESFACAELKAIPVSVVASEDSEIMLIDSSHIIHTCQNNCGHHQQKIDVTSKRTTRDKLLTYLDIYAKKVGSDSFEIPFDRQELADYLEVDRSGLSAEISKLRDEGAIICKKSSFTLLR